MMHMENYEGSVATLNIGQEMSPAEYDNVFHGSNKLADKVKQLSQRQTKVSNVLDEYWSGYAQSKFQTIPLLHFFRRKNKSKKRKGVEYGSRSGESFVD